MHKSKKDEKKLIKRYLIWCYKTTKEELDRIDRKFTQLSVDHFILQQLRRQKGKLRFKVDQKDFLKKFKEFEAYIALKENEASRQKFFNESKKQLKGDYLFLKARLGAIEKAIKRFLGRKELNVIRSLYEQEMTSRILQAREHT